MVFKTWFLRWLANTSFYCSLHCRTNVSESSSYIVLGLCSKNNKIPSNFWFHKLINDKISKGTTCFLETGLSLLYSGKNITLTCYWANWCKHSYCVPDMNVMLYRSVTKQCYKYLTLEANISNECLLNPYLGTQMKSSHFFQRQWTIPVMIFLNKTTSDLLIVTMGSILKDAPKHRF